MRKFYKYIPVLTIAGSDSGGCAGVQADLKTFSALGCFGFSVITAVTAQNTQGVDSVYNIPAEFAALQLEVVISDIKPEAIKIGMISNSDLVYSLAEILKKHRDIPIVLDPVMVSTSGHRLIDKDTVRFIKKELFPLASIITPNLDEASVLTQMPVKNLEDMKKASLKLLDSGTKSVIIKGGHLDGEIIYDVYTDSMNYEEIFQTKKILTQNMHGTGCTFSSAIAAFLARSFTVNRAVVLAEDYIHKAIEHGADVKIGEGTGPVNHFFKPLNLIKNELDR